MLDLGRHKVRRELLREIAQRGVGDDGHLPDALVVIADKAEVSRQRAKTVPPGKSRGLDDETGETAGGFDVRVHRFRELGKVFFLERGLWSHVENRVRGVEIVFDHWRTPLLLDKYPMSLSGKSIVIPSAPAWTTCCISTSVATPQARTTNPSACRRFTRTAVTMFARGQSWRRPRCRACVMIASLTSGTSQPVASSGA